MFPVVSVFYSSRIIVLRWLHSSLLALALLNTTISSSILALSIPALCRVKGQGTDSSEISLRWIIGEERIRSAGRRGSSRTRARLRRRNFGNL